MIYLAIISGLLVLALVYRETQHSKHVADREKTWDLERGSLLTRIQHPEVVMIPRPIDVDGEKLVADDIEKTDDIDLVGTVVDGEHG